MTYYERLAVFCCLCVTQNYDEFCECYKLLTSDSNGKFFNESKDRFYVFSKPKERLEDLEGLSPIEKSRICQRDYRARHREEFNRRQREQYKQRKLRGKK